MGALLNKLGLKPLPQPARSEDSSPKGVAAPSQEAAGFTRQFKDVLAKIAELDATKVTNVAQLKAAATAAAKLASNSNGLLVAKQLLADVENQVTEAKAASDREGPQAIETGAPLPASGMKDEEIAAAIMDAQVGIIVGWQTALQVFDKTMTSSSDAEAKPDFQKVVVQYFADKLMGALMKHAPGASELDALVKALDGEYKRAAAAGASATLRDFVIQHAKAIGQLQQATLAQRQGFISAVRARREAVEAPRPIKTKGKSGKGGLVETTKEDDAYGLMRMALMDTLDNVNKVLSASTEEVLFQVLSAEWIRHATVNIGMGVQISAWVVIRLNPDYSVKDARILGSGGQKLAEQLLKDTPEGVDVFGLKTPRKILLLADNGWPEITLSLDANNNNVSTGSFGEGNTDKLMRYVMSKGLSRTKKITGD